MNQVSEVRCPLCNTMELAIAATDEPTDAQRLYPPEPLDIVLNARMFRAGAYWLLHHVCANRLIAVDSDWDHVQDWWACMAPARPLNDHTYFDVNCVQCAQRWNQAYGGPPVPGGTKPGRG